MGMPPGPVRPTPGLRTGVPMILEPAGAAVRGRVKRSVPRGEGATTAGTAASLMRLADGRWGRFCAALRSVAVGVAAAAVIGRLRAAGGAEAGGGVSLVDSSVPAKCSGPTSTSVDAART